MHCHSFESMLAEQIDGPLSADALAHLETCPGCRLLREDLQAIAVAAQEWGTETLAPPQRVWDALRTQLQAEGLIAPPAALPIPPAGWLSGLWNLASHWELAGAYLLAMLVAGGVAGYRDAPAAGSFERRAPTAQLSRPALDGLGSTLDGNMQRVVASFSPDNSVTVSLRKNLQIVDNLIAVCEKTVREHPGDPLAREYLYGAYQQKADLLAVAMDRSAMEIQ